MNISNIQTLEDAEKVSTIFSDLRIEECYFDIERKEFLLKTKTQLLKIVLQDFLEGNGYYLKSYIPCKDYEHRGTTYKIEIMKRE